MDKKEVRPKSNLFLSLPKDGLLVAADHGSELSRKVLLLLLDALALFEANSGVEANLAAQRLGSVVHIPVSYTHLDVYKRQQCSRAEWSASGQPG